MEHAPLFRTAHKNSYPDADLLAVYLDESASRHQHLCPRQVLGIRMGLYGLQIMGLTGPQYEPRFYNERKQLLTIMETDGCGADGVAIATGCYVGRRTMRVVDFGKMAATFVHTQTGAAIRVLFQTGAGWPAPLRLMRAAAGTLLYHAYQIMPDDLLLSAHEVTLTQSIATVEQTKCPGNL